MKFTEQEKYDICMTSSVGGGYSLGIVLMAISLINYLFVEQVLDVRNLVIGSVLLGGGIVSSRLILRYFRRNNSITSLTDDEVKN